MTIHMRIMTMDEGPQIVADCPEWDAPVPRVGDYIFHPPFAGREAAGSTNVAGSVKSVTWRTHDRPADEGTECFVQTASPYVELYI